MPRSFMDRLLRRPQKIIARLPSEPTVYSFRALKDFFADEVKSQYARGELYRVRQGNEKLNRLVEQWLADGKVEKL